MRKGVLLPVVAIAGLLSGCGGGGGDSRPEVVAPPPPTAPEPQPEPEPEPEPEPPVGPESIHDLRQNRTFTARAASSSVTINRTSGNAAPGTASTGTFTVSYNAAAKSYTLAVPGHSATFSPADISPDSTANITVYQKEGASRNEQMILLKTALDSTAGPQHVGMGMWQRNTLRPEETDMQFDTFVYGFEAPVAAVPRTGTGSFRVDVLGLATSPGYEPWIFEGTGRFGLDFGTGIFSTRTELLETGILTSATDSGTGYELTGTGTLSSADGTFSGRIVYGGNVGQLPGTLSGRFYGPDARELGASFSATDGNGKTVVGGMTGSWLSETPSVNLTLTNLVQPERFAADHAHMDRTTGEPTTSDSQLFLRPDGSLEFTSSTSMFGSVALTSESRVTSADPNFTAYEKTVDGQTVRLEMYKPGQANAELKLTYASFGKWNSAPAGGTLADGDRMFFTYGLRTPEGALSARTGTARYEGVAHGAAYDTVTSVRYDVSGTSRFDVDFSGKTLSGNLTLAGKTVGGAGQVDFGTYQFGGGLDSMNRYMLALKQGASHAGVLQAGFYGPNGEEIAGSFQMAVPNANASGVTSIVGATVATQR